MGYIVKDDIEYGGINKIVPNEKSFDNIDAYLAWKSSSEYDPETTCYVKGIGFISASLVNFDNTDTSLQATNVQGAIKEINDSLTANSATFNLQQLDDGTWGWNESPTRGADTFHPFKGGGDITRMKMIAKKTQSAPSSGSTTSKITLTEEQMDADLYIAVAETTNGTGGAYYKYAVGADIPIGSRLPHSTYRGLRLFSRDGNVVFDDHEGYVASPTFNRATGVFSFSTATDYSATLYCFVVGVYF